MKNNINLYWDGFNSKLIETAFFEGTLEMPIMAAPQEIILPAAAIPFSKRKYLNDPASEMLVFYERDKNFRAFVSVPQNYMQELERVKIFSTPDCSLYRDSPLAVQIANTFVSRSIGYYLQQQGKYVIPNARWGDERTYRRLKGFPDEMPIAFAGLPKNSILSIGTYGCCQSKENKYYLEAGLESMLAELAPRAVVVYGAYNRKIFGKYEAYTHFHPLPDWTTRVHQRKEVPHGNQ